jgi:phosphate:Na+ symporter
MEDSLRQLAGRRFKLFLKKHTANKVKAIGAGAVVTGFLQSSSVVNLLVLSMVGASVVKMENALAIMLGSNLGTTIGSWMLATLGFNFNIENFALPVAAIAGIGMAFINNGSKWFLWLKFLFSLAFLFIALGFIKTGMEDFVSQTDLSAFNQYPLIIFLLLGILLTTAIQSSSATIALALSALHANAITLYVATAIVLGSEIGTTFKLFLVAAKGLVAKKRVALGNFLFNVITVSLMFIILKPVNYLITNVLEINNNLIALVFFQSFVNFCSIILFFPFLKIFGQFLLKQFTGKEEESIYISKVPVTDTELALEALENETKLFINYVIDYSLDSFDLKESINRDLISKMNFQRKTVGEKYDHIKQSHGEMHAFYLKLQSASSNKMEAERMEQLISALRNTMYAAKNIKDAQHDIEQVRNSSNDTKYNFYIKSRERLLTFYQQVLAMLDNETKKNLFDKLTDLYHSVTAGYTETLHLLYKENMAKQVSEIEISTLINLNRELYTSFKSILFGLKDFLLTPKEAEYFDTLPGFIR